MTIKEMLIWAKENNTIMYNQKCEAKPEGVMTLNQLLKAGLKPNDVESCIYYRMRYNNGIEEDYPYYAQGDTSEMTASELAEFNAIQEEKRVESKQRSQKREQEKVIAKKEEYNTLISTVSEMLKRSWSDEEKAVLEYALGRLKIDSSRVSSIEPKSDKHIKILGEDDFSKKEIIVLDLETTGFNPVTDDILQVSMMDNHKHKLDSYIRPVTKTEWPDAEKINHITYDMVKDAVTLEQIKPRIEQLLASADYVVGHNVMFDLRFISRKLGIRVPDEKIVDTCDMFREFNPNCSHKLATLTEMFASNETKQLYANGAHNSLVDIRATYEGLVGLCKVMSSVA